MHVAMVKVILADEKKDQAVLTYLKGDHMSDIGAQIYESIEFLNGIKILDHCV